jgi:hypothetical protein
MKSGKGDGDEDDTVRELILATISAAVVQSLVK